MTESAKTETSPKERPLIAARERGGYGIDRPGEPRACILPPSLSFAGPGPGRYALPSTLGSVNHDPTKKTNPSYRFGMRLNNASEQCAHERGCWWRCPVRAGG